MTILPRVICPCCLRSIISRQSDNRIKAPLSYADCLRQCEACGIGFSNANSSDVKDLTQILRDPFAGVPHAIADGWQEVAAQALNVTNRKTKHARMSSLNSEDHVTWTVFRYVQFHQLLRPSLAVLGSKWMDSTPEEPTILLRGVPVPLKDAKGQQARTRLCQLLEGLGENPAYLSEPDVIVDYGEAGVLFIEVKLKSLNVSSNAEERWNKYLTANSTDLQPFRDIEGIRQTGLYELMRNWRIAWDFAAGRPMALVNLGPEALFVGAEGEKLREFQTSLSQNAMRQFIPLTWGKFLKAIPHREEWFQEYLVRRQITLG